MAAGFCSLALGTQTIGSISRPASYCGIAGWKPSYDRTSRQGVVPFSPSLDHVGLLAPDVASLAMAAPVITPDWNQEEFDEARTRYSRVRPIVVIPEGLYLDQAESATLEAFHSMVARLRGAGFSVISKEVFGDIDDINDRHRRIAAAEMERSHRPWSAGREELYAVATRELIQKGAAIDDNQLELDKTGRASLRTILENQLEDAGAHFWISPAATGPATLGLDSTGSPLMNLPWTHAGLPTLALPTKHFVDGMPVGLQLSGHFGSDETILALGSVMETALMAQR